MPAIDIARSCGSRLELTEIAVVGGEIPYSFVRLAWLVLFVRPDQLDLVMKDLEGVIDRHLKSNLDVLGESLVLNRLE